MTKNRSLVSASDIGAWTFCNRAWWLSRVQKVSHQSPHVLEKGDAFHASHGRQVAWTRRLRRVGWLLVGCSLVLLLLWLAIWFGSS